MILLNIPSFPARELKHLVLDFNGTLAHDGRLIEGVRERLATLAANLEVRIVTADTFGGAGEALDAEIAEVTVLEPGQQDERKEGIVRALGAESVVAIGNGANDGPMLSAAAIGIAVVQGEGAAMATLVAADIVVRDIRDALDLLLFPKRLTATLRR